ncbi:MAG TPA: TrmO family methyltransferase [Acidimicrobiales bacterium]|nr:TrmO family methyltransferase [Acidimicrobiales bacterium]
MPYEVRAVAHVAGGRRALTDDGWGPVRAALELAPEVPAEALAGLEAFSHVEVVALADQASDVPPAPWRRHPRHNPAWPAVGIFAQRNKDRPNRLLVSVATIVRVTPRAIEVEGLDLIEGTPILDIKPVYAWIGPRGTVRTARWSDQLGAAYY